MSRLWDSTRIASVFFPEQVSNYCRLDSEDDVILRLGPFLLARISQNNYSIFPSNRELAGRGGALVVAISLLQPAC
jgi:hypothetical protein